MTSTPPLASGPNFLITVSARILVLDVCARPEQSLAEGAAHAGDMFAEYPRLAAAQLGRVVGGVWDLLDAPVPGPVTQRAMQAAFEALQRTGFPLAVCANHATTKMFMRRVLFATLPGMSALATSRAAAMAWCGGLPCEVESSAPLG